MTRKTLLGVLGGCLFCACGTPVRDSVVLVADSIRTVRIDRDTPTLPIDRIVRHARYIRLETGRQSLVGQPTRMLFADSLVIVVDNRYSPRVVAFGLDGRYRCTYGIFGRGPGEYSELGWAALTPDSERLVIADYAAARYHYYHMDGTFDRSTPLDWRGCSFEFLTPDSIATANFGPVYLTGKGEQTGMLVLSDLKTGEGSQMFPYLFAQRAMPVNPTGGLCKYGDAVYYIPLLNDTVYRVHPDRMEALYAVDVAGVRRPGYEATAEAYMDFIDKNPCFNGNFVEADDFALFGMYAPSRPVLYDKKRGRSYRIGLPERDGLCSFFRDGYILTRRGRGTVVVEMSAAAVLDRVSRMERPLAPEVQALVEGLNEEDNPVVFCYDIVPPES